MINRYGGPLALIIVTILLITFTGCKKIDVLNINLKSVNDIRIIDGNTGESVDISKDTNSEIFDYIINHFESVRYEKTNKSGSYGGYRYFLLLSGESEYSITVLNSQKIDFDGNMYVSDESIDLKKIEKLFND